ncbi:hypothetical protein [Streptomyces sp. W1SF4]|uniref:hypothetical protein n=1 Tax=Streptomyces sp. W1SF4 TaxID=2305220 RepID=UPI000F6FA80F|nr:hypothetical protein [Streptomyces sp. W1SF4]AZM92605.1 hypothetical protein D1J60_32575 [Streptomyces sp. W1SF4]
MTEELNVLRLSVRNDPAFGPYEYLEVRPLVDGVDVIEAAFGQEDHGVQCGDPRDWLVPDGPLSVGEGAHWVEFASKACGCHDLLYLTLRRDGDIVVWSWESAEAGIQALPEYRFDAAQYDAELERARRDGGWEWPAQTVSRLVLDGLRGQTGWLERWSCELGHVWTDPKHPGQVLLYFFREERDTQGRYGRAEEFAMMAPVTDEDPARQAGRIVRAFLAGDPRTVDGLRPCPMDEVGYGHYHGDGPTPWKLHG